MKSRFVENSVVKNCQPSPKFWMCGMALFVLCLNPSYSVGMKNETIGTLSKKQIRELEKKFIKFKNDLNSTYEQFLKYREEYNTKNKELALMKRPVAEVGKKGEGIENKEEMGEE